MNHITQHAVDYLRLLGFVVETAGNRFTVAADGEILLARGNAREIYIFAQAVSAGREMAHHARKEAALDRALGTSSVHQKEMRDDR